VLKKTQNNNPSARHTGTEQKKKKKTHPITTASHSPTDPNGTTAPKLCPQLRYRKQLKEKTENQPLQ